MDNKSTDLKAEEILKINQPTIKTIEDGVVSVELKSEYIQTKTSALRMFGYAFLKESEVEETLDELLNGKEAKSELEISIKNDLYFETKQVNRPKPIFIVLLPKQCDLDNLKRVKNNMPEGFTNDYNVIVTINTKDEIDFKAFYEKDFNEAKFEELKELVVAGLDIKTSKQNIMKEVSSDKNFIQYMFENGYNRNADKQWLDRGTKTIMTPARLRYLYLQYAGEVF